MKVAELLILLPDTTDSVFLEIPLITDILLEWTEGVRCDVASSFVETILP